MQGVDPILTQKLRMRKTGKYVAELLLPVIPVTSKSVQLPIAPEDQFKIFDTIRPAGGASNIMRPTTATTVTKELIEHDVSYPIDYIEEAIAFMQLRQFGAQTAQDIVRRRYEYDAAALLQTAGNYSSANKIALSTTTCWDNASSHPLAQIEVAKTAVFNGCGAEANAIFFDNASLGAFTQHADVIARKVYTVFGSVTRADIASITNIKNVIIGSATYKNDAGTAYPIWADSVIVAYIPELNNDEPPSIMNLDAYFGATLRMTSKQIADQWAAPDGKVSYMRYTDVRLPVLYQTEITGAYLIANTIA
jgi:hypothetical protein